jgi:hypothetical protein
VLHLIIIFLERIYDYNVLQNIPKIFNVVLNDGIQIQNVLLKESLITFYTGVFDFLHLNFIFYFKNCFLFIIVVFKFILTFISYILIYQLLYTYF